MYSYTLYTCRKCHNHTAVLHGFKWTISIPVFLVYLLILGNPASAGHSSDEHYYVTNEFRCYEAKIDESEKGGSCWESNPGHFWFEPPVLCCWAMTAGWQPTWKSSICSPFISSVRQDALNYYVTYASANSWHTNIHVMTDNRMQLLVSLRFNNHYQSMALLY